MAQEFYYPIAGATHNLPAGYDDFTLDAGANKNVACLPGGGRLGPMTHDDDSSSISMVSNNTPHYQSLNTDWPGPMATYGGVLTAGARHKTTSGSPTRGMYISNAAGTLGTIIFSSGEASGAYVNSGLVDISNAATYRPGGGAWTAADFVNDQTMFLTAYENTLAATTARFTSLWGEISFTPPAGGFVFLLGLALPIVGAMDFGHFTRYLSWRRALHPRHTILTPDEVVQAWREVRAYRHPRFFEVAA